MAIEDLKRWLEHAQGPWLEELQRMGQDSVEIEKRFGRELSFGTAGLRGILGSGSDRMNIYTVGLATQAFADVLLESGEEKRVAVAYDSRLGSRLFAQRTAEVFAANEVKVFLFDRLMPTPVLSFAVRELGCGAGVMITASHNPSQYNGYKAYGKDGGQILPEAADKIGRRMAQLDCFAQVKALPLEQARSRGLVEKVPEEVVSRYLEAVSALSLEKDKAANSQLPVLYTPLNGAGLECVTKTMKAMGFSQLRCLEAQKAPDGNFPTCPTPNPELREAMALGIEECLRTGTELLVATDPDCDRIGVWTADGSPKGRLLTGNEIGALLLDYICARKRQNGAMPLRPLAVKSIVSTDMADKIAARYGVEMQTVLTGFKYVGQVISRLEKEGRREDFLFGFEESHGYLSGVHVRDKDGVNALLLVCELAAACRKEGKTLADKLEELYQTYGSLCSRVVNIAFSGIHPMEEMKTVMEKLRRTPPRRLGGQPVTCWGDYLAGVEIREGESRPIDIEDKTNMLRLQLGEKGWAVVRPSGTEPKMKIYLNFWGDTQQEAEELAQKTLTQLREILEG